MPPSNRERTEESSDRSIGERLGFERRPLLKALGAGTTLSLGSSTAAASGSESAGAESADAESEPPSDEHADAEIDPLYGYATPDAEEIPAGLEPAHEVEMLVAPPGPEQPPLPYFDPTGLRVDPGDVVQFTSLSPDHTVTAYHPGIGFERGRVPEDAGPFSSPVLGPGGAWLYRFEHEGVYDVYCGPHHLNGMVMRLVVGDLAEEDVPDYAETVEGIPGEEGLSAALDQFSEQNENCEWPFLTPAEVFDVDVLDPTTIRDAGEVPFEAVAAELGYALEREETAAPTVQVSTHPEYGKILAGPDGRTVYMFDRDTQGEATSSCHEDCASAWPPLTGDGMPTAGEAVTAELGTFERVTGETQVTANGWPLYYFDLDGEPGDVEGQGVNDVWWVLGPDGTPVRSGSTE